MFYDSSILDNTTIYYFDQVIKQQKKDKDIKCVSKIFMEYKKEIFKCHSNCEFFELFINPWISIDTLVNLNNDLIDKIRIYLTECCHIVKDQILSSPKGIFNIYQDLKKDIMVSENGTETSEFDLNTLEEGIKDVNDHSLLSFINKICAFNLETVRVKRVNDNQTIVISKLDDRKQIQFLYNEEEKKLDMILIDGDSVSKISFPVDANKKFKLQVSIYLQNLIQCFSLLYLKAAISIAIENLQYNDLELLKNR